MWQTSVDMECSCCFFLQAEDGIRDLVRSRGLGDVYKRQEQNVESALKRGVDTCEVGGEDCFGLGSDEL